MGIFAMVAMTGIVATGCGSDDSTVFTQQAQQQLREFIILPNAATDSVSVRGIDTQTGNTAVLSNNPTGSTPSMVRTHPTRNLFYVSNLGSSNISGFSIDTNGGTSNLSNSPYAGPAGCSMVAIHPSGQFVYAAGGAEIRSYSVGADGSLSQIGVQALANGARFDGCFSNQGRFLHIPTVAGITTLTVNQATGLLSAPVNTAAAGGVLDVSIHPNGTLLIGTVQVAGANNDQAAPFTVDGNGALTAQAVTNLGYETGFGEIARNGQFYTGEIATANIRGFNVTSNNGALAAITGSPFAAAGGGAFIGIDPTNSLIYSAANSGTTLAGARRLADGTLQAAQNSPFTGNLSTPFVFDFFQFVQ